jgi:hypothetical protein
MWRGCRLAREDDEEKCNKQNGTPHVAAETRRYSLNNLKLPSELFNP